MKLKTALTALILLLVTAWLPVQHARGESVGEITVTSKTANVRDGAGLDYPIVKKLTKGNRLEIVRVSGDWYEIKIGDGKTGWIANWLVEKSAGQAVTTANQGTITGNSVNVRIGPGTTFQTVSKLTKGTHVGILETNENWVKIQIGGNEGWVSAAYVQLPATSKKTAGHGQEASGNLKIGRVMVDHLNVRSEPSTTSASLGKLNKDTSVTVYQVNQAWAQIDFQGQKGWVSATYIELGKDEDSKEINKGTTTAKISATGLHVRKKSSLNSEIIGSVNKGESYPVLQQKGQMTELQLSSTKKGWVVSWYLEIENEAQTTKKKSRHLKGSEVTIIHDGTILRSKPNTESEIVGQAKSGEIYPVTGMKGDWYSITLQNGKTAYVAGWIVNIEGNTEQVKRAGVEKYLEDKVIVIDPGHGGRDSGTIGVGGTLEKNLTIQTAELLRDKLQAAGAKVVLTRNSNTYVALPSRVSIAHIHNADAFISLHYDSTIDRITSGITTYYYHGYQQALASSIAHSLGASMQVPNRGYRYGDYHVIRENKRVAALIELGYLSNPVDELTITTNEYQETVTSAIYNGLARYFK